MTGYRDATTGYDPNAYEQPGRPLKPYNWVQWTGVALTVLGLGIFLGRLAADFGWIERSAVPSLGFPAMIIGWVLINSRREPGSPAGSEQLQRNRRLLLIAIAVLALIFGAAITISAFTGA